MGGGASSKDPAKGEGGGGADDSGYGGEESVVAKPKFNLGAQADPVRDAIKLHLHLAPAVPEPQTWAMAAVGVFGLLGMSALRQRRRG